MTEISISIPTWFLWVFVGAMVVWTIMTIFEIKLNYRLLKEQQAKYQLLKEEQERVGRMSRSKLR